MSDELKDYLGNINYEIETSDIELEKLDIGLNAISWKELLDYITNLEEQLHQASLDIQELTEKDIGCPSWCDKLNNLEKENKIQKEKIEHLLIDLRGESEYKQRNEKAIEYINKLSNEPNAFGHYGIDGNCKKYLLNILKGE